MITLESLPNATPQEVYDQVATHLRSMTKKSYSSITENCLYRGPNNNRCAAGCLISDKEYDPKFDEIGFWGDLVEEEVVPRSHQDLIISLQIVHDDMSETKWNDDDYRALEKALKSVSKTYSLTYKN